MKDWIRFVITFLVVLFVFGVADDYLSPRSCLASYGSNITAIIKGCAIHHATVYAIPFLTGLAVSLLISVYETPDRKKTLARRFNRGVYISIPIAIIILAMRIIPGLHIGL